MKVSYVHAPHVRSAVHGDRTVLLDLRRERYYSLDDVGSRIWALVGEGADVPEMVRRLHDEFDAPVERIEEDVKTFLRRLTDEMKVVMRVIPPAAPAEPSGFTCAFTLLTVALSLRVIGLRRTLIFAERLGHRARPAAEPSAAFLRDVVRKVATSAAFFPGRALCLEQSLTLYTCLRRSGVPAELRIGAQPYPFAAHAWVEYQGELVGSTHDQVCHFVRFDRLAETT